jgi:hypothetical protein
MQKTIILILCWLIFICLGCSNKSASVQTGYANNEFPVIIHLEKRNEIVTIMSGREGLLYTVKTKDGRTLGHHLSEQDLQTKLPDIYNSLKKSYADINQRSILLGDY